MYLDMWMKIWNLIGTGVCCGGEAFWSDIIQHAFEHWVRCEDERPLENGAFPPSPVLFTDLLNLLHSVDTSIGPFVSKTLVRHAVFLRKLEATLPECVSYFRARTLKLSESLLSDNYEHIGLLPPNMLSGVDYKAKLEKLIIWNDTIGYSFFHTYASNGNVSQVLVT